MGGAPTGPGTGEVATRARQDIGEGVMMRFGDGPRRRRMIRGTIARIGELAMRYGHPSQLATLDCTSSRRSTVMCALPRATAVTTVYQRDSSSKRPRASVVSAARVPTASEYHVADTASRASRPAGGACGAPGHRARHVVRGSYASKLTLAGYRQATIERSGLDKGSFHIRPKNCRRAVFSSSISLSEAAVLFRATTWRKKAS